MFALVEDGKITQMPKGNKGITLGDNQYPASIYTLWTEAERNAIGIYTVEIDETNTTVTVSADTYDTTSGIGYTAATSYAS